MSYLQNLNTLRGKFRTSVRADLQPAVLGDGAGTVDHPTQPGMAWARRYRGSGVLSAPFPVYMPAGKLVDWRDGVQVLLEPYRDGFRIAEPDNAAAVALGNNPVSALRPTTPTQMSQGGLATLKCIASDPPSLLVNVRGWNLINAGTYYELSWTGVDLSSYIPAADLMRFAVLGIAALTGDSTDIEIQCSTARAITDVPLGADDVTEALNAMSAPALSRPVWAIRLIGGQTTITQAAIDTDGRDLRQLVNAVGAGYYQTVDVDGVDFAQRQTLQLQTGIGGRLSGADDSVQTVVTVGARQGESGGLAPLTGGWELPSFAQPLPNANAGITEPSRWIRPTSPILSPSESWEGTSVSEPTVIFDAGIWKLWYRGGFDPAAGIGYATCPSTSDPTIAANWTKYAGNPIFGDSTSRPQQPNVLKVLDTFYMFYADVSQNLKRATSADGITWTSPVTLLTHDSTITQWANTAVWVEYGGQWKMLVEGLRGGIWQIHLATSTDGVTWALGNSGNALTTLQVHAGGSYGGPGVFVPSPRFQGKYEVWYHAVNVSGSLPTDLYRAFSTDLINWVPYAHNPVLTHTGTGFEIDQVADPDIHEMFGQSYLFYDGDDNPNSAGDIGIVSFDGPLATLVGEGALPAPLDSSGKVPAVNLPTVGIYAPLCTGDTPGPVLLATADGQCVMAQIQ